MAFAYSPKIVTDGLVFAVDAGNIKSYPGSGTTWKDLSGNGNDGTLTNGPTFDSANGGIIKGDGTDSYIQIGDTYDSFQFTTNWTYCGFVYCNMTIEDTDNSSTAIWNKGATNGGISQTGIQATFRGGIYNGAYFRLTGAGGAPYPNTDIIPTTDYRISMSNSWSFLSLTKQSNLYKMYYNGNLIRTLTDTYDRNINSNTLNFRYMGNNGGGKIWLGPQTIYHKTLTDQEVLQNYNALKGRFGL